MEFFFIHLDIKNFFGSINKSRVTRTLKSFFGYPEARRVASESTVRKPGSNSPEFMLPFGFVQSPIVASICLFKSGLGRHLGTLAKSKDAVVSVYMDDIIISLKEKPLASQVVADVKKAAVKSNFELNDAKEEGPSDEITSFNINLSHNHLAITSERIIQFASDYANADNDFQREGFKRYIASVNPEQVKLLS